MSKAINILIIGTADTKADELLFMRQCIEGQGAHAPIMDVGVLGTPPFAPEHPNRAVAAAAGTTIEAIAKLGDENEAMAKMAEGATALVLTLYMDGKIDGIIALGGTMGTDLALDVASALPMGVPKFVVSTVSFSHLIPPERLAPDLMMILWAGGLYGLNSICKSVLSQAAGAVVGAAKAGTKPQTERPLIGIGSLGKSCIDYMVRLKPALEARGYEVAVFHCTGMGGRAIESLARQKRFAAVLDLCIAEASNSYNDSLVNAGASRLEAAGEAGIPQIVAPCASDMIDFQTWAGTPEKYKGRPYHAHNRLIASTIMTVDEKRGFAHYVGSKLAKAKGPTVFVMPTRSLHAWDKPGEPLYDPEGLRAMTEGFREAIKPPVRYLELDANANDPAFSDAVLRVFDDWVREGKVVKGAA
ncbi:MAG: Tm-1-like ATP-binding domain-containing protein [Hyphomicrobiaceae bacterium]